MGRPLVWALMAPPSLGPNGPFLWALEGPLPWALEGPRALLPWALEGPLPWTLEVPSPGLCGGPYKY